MTTYLRTRRWSVLAFVALACAPAACAPSSRPEPAPPADAPHDGSSSSVIAEAAPATTAPAAPANAAPPAPAPDAAPAASASASKPASAPVKVVTVGMHVAGGPFDEPTKEPFKKAVEPHFPEMTACVGKHVANPPKQADVGVDLLIEASGGKPKVSNPRSTFDKGESEGLLPCIIGVFESVDFPKLDRGRTGVSYSLRFTRK